MKPVKSRTRRYRIAIIPTQSLARESHYPTASLLHVESAIGELHTKALSSSAHTVGEPNSLPRVLKKLGPSEGTPHTLVVALDDHSAARLKEMYGAQLEILSDEVRLDLLESGDRLQGQWARLAAADATQELRVRIAVVDEEGQPIAGAGVELEGSLDTGIASTTADGIADLLLLGESVETLELLTVTPRSGFWSRRVEQPLLDGTATFEVRLRSLGALEVGDVVPWGIAALGDLAKPTGGMPIRVAVVDTGIDAEHPDLNVESEGLYTSDQDAGDHVRPWRTDEGGHGTHVAGTIAAISNNAGVRGVMGSGVQLHSLKVFPSPRISNLIEAIDWCVEHEIDIINLSLGADVDDEGMKRAMGRARDAGCVPIAAAGNSGGGVLSPARLDDVIAVAAVGDPSAFDDESTHARWLKGEPGSSGYLPAGFTCLGEEIDHCAPGVGIVSTIPGGGWAAKDGTSMACPHVAGVAAALLSKRADIIALPRDRARSDAIVMLLKESATSLGLGPDIEGDGMPRLSTASVEIETDASKVRCEELEQLFESFLGLLEQRLK